MAKGNTYRLMEGFYSQIKELEPTGEEIKAFGEEFKDCYGVVLYTDDEYYFGPRLHDTWRQKGHSGGSIHIDIGSHGYHLHLDKMAAPAFIDFIKDSRKQSKGG